MSEYDRLKAIVTEIGARQLARIVDPYKAQIVALTAQRDACLDVCRGYVSDYEDTFISPEEMTGEAKDLYGKAKAAIALCQPAPADNTLPRSAIIEGLRTLPDEVEL